MLHVKQRAVCQAILTVIGNRLTAQNLPVLFDENNIGMVIRNAHLRVGLTMVYGYNNIEGAAARKMLNLHRHLFHKLLHLLNLLRTNLGNDLQLFIRVTCHNTCSHCRIDAL